MNFGLYQRYDIRESDEHSLSPNHDFYEVQCL